MNKEAVPRGAESVCSHSEGERTMIVCVYNLR